MYRICTWNTQGDPTNTPDKLEILKTLLERNDVVLLQECTRLDHFHLIRNSNSFHIFISPLCLYINIFRLNINLFV